MKKSFFIILCLFFIAQSASYARTSVTALSDFNTETPKEQIIVKVNEDVVIDKDIKIPQNSIIENEICTIKAPKRLKRDASFVAKSGLIKEPNGKEYNIENLYVTYKKPIDKKKISKKVALGIGNFFVENISLGYNVIEGAVKNEEGNRMKSAIKNAYETSPVSLAKKGNALNIVNGDIIYLQFDIEKSKN